MPSASNPGATGPMNKTLFSYDELGRIFYFSPQGQNLTKADGSAITCTFQKSISLGGDSPPTFVPRSLIIPIYTVATSANGVSGTISVTIGFDGVFQSSPSASYDIGSQLTGKKNRISVPIKYTSTSLPKPLTMQVKIVLTGGSSTLGFTRIEPFYISDEVLG
jgi:hypothetical protein